MLLDYSIEKEKPRFHFVFIQLIFISCTHLHLQDAFKEKNYFAFCFILETTESV